MTIKNSFQYDFDTLKKALLFNTKEIIPNNVEQLDQEIRTLIGNANQTGQKIRHYIGFEISGQIHIGGGLFPMLQAVELQKAGVEINLWIADYHTWLNNKLDGKLETIKKVAREYFAPVMLECFKVAGGDPNLVNILYNFDDYRNVKNGVTFWDYEFQVDKNLTLNRMLRSMSIMGRDAGEDVEYQMTRYPGMQCADVFWLQAHISQGGLDQRKIYVTARDVAYSIDEEFRLKIGQKTIKPIAPMSPLLHGLLPPEVKDGVNEIAKMSKSKPDSAIWVHDPKTEIARKLKQAYCPMPKENQTREEITLEQSFNPLLNWCQNLIYPGGKIIDIKRPEKFGGDIIYSDYESLEADYFDSKIHPLDLKNAVADCLSQWLFPIYDFAQKNPEKLELVLSAIR